jgi:hypothetical protein
MAVNNPIAGTKSSGSLGLLFPNAHSNTCQQSRAEGTGALRKILDAPARRKLMPVKAR